MIITQYGANEFAFLSWQIRVCSNSTLCSCLNVKEPFASYKRYIWKLGDCNETWTHNNLNGNRTPNYLPKQVKWLSCAGSTYLRV